MKDGLRDTASFASLTNWGKSWRDVEERNEERERENRGRMEARQGTTTNMVEVGGGGVAGIARGHNLWHLLAVIDQRERREGNGVCGLLQDEVMG